MIDVKSTSVPRAAARNALVAAVLVTLVACISSGPSTTRAPSADQTQTLEARAQAALRDGDLASAAEIYAELAASVTGPMRSSYLIESARLSAERNDAATARRRLDDARAGASRDQLQAITVLTARLEVAERRAQAALDLLASLQPPSPDSVLRDAAAVRGQALFQLGRPADAIRALVEREVWLEDSGAILANQRMIWDGFRQYPTRNPPAPTGDRVIDGWIALAPLATSGSTDLRRSLLSWRTTYTDHPAAGVLLADLLSAQRGAGFPARIALLLPLSSPQRALALAVRDGFLAAHLRGGAEDTAIRIYDTQQGGAQNAYLQAQLDGAEFIVGPLLRPDVEQVITQAGFVPTLALNFAQTETPLLRSFYQFSLSPDDEARVIADSIATTGARTAIAFIPSSDRGYRTLNSFRAQFEARGGKLLDFFGYEASLQDFSQPIAGVLNITRSTQRQRRLAANLGTAVQFEPRRRQDVDAIFIAADDTRAGRLLAPQLRFNSAGDIPTFATSDVFDPGNTGRVNDLNGVIFPDAPVVISPTPDALELQREIQQYWPQRGGFVRLYAMGFDAYELVRALYRDDRSVWPLSGLSGDLTLDDTGKIRRALPLAQIRNGRPVAYEVPIGESAPRELVGTR